MKAGQATILNVSKLSGGMLLYWSSSQKGTGNPPATGATSPMVGVGTPAGRRMACSTMTAATMPKRAGGTEMGTQRSNIVATMIVTKTSSIMYPISVPSRQGLSAFPPSWKDENWPIKMMMASALEKPTMAERGSSFTNRGRLSMANSVWYTEIMRTIQNSISTPSDCTYGAMVAARTPVAPLIMPGRLPKPEVHTPMIQAGWRPSSGSTPAMEAKASEPGTWANATVNPARISRSTCFQSVL